MGIVNATTDSFSDAGRYTTLEARLELALELVHDGAEIIDIGGESASPATPTLDPQQEIGRVVPLIEAVACASDATISIDTYKPAVARAAVSAGASIINDISGLADPELADICAETGAALVIMHNRGVPKRRLLDPELYDDVAGDVLAFLAQRIELAEAHGVLRQQIIIDPGPDFSKTPAQTIDVLRRLDLLQQLGARVLLPISRKDFIGALTGRAPRSRLGGTLAALDHGMRLGAHIFRVHDVAGARAFIDARLALAGDTA